MKKFTLHLMVHEGMERFADGVASNNKIVPLLEKAREIHTLEGSGWKIQWKWRIVRNEDNVTLAQSKTYEAA